jgi:hypothetical protein
VLTRGYNAEKVQKAGVEKEADYLYFIDKVGRYFKIVHEQRWGKR